MRLALALLCLGGTAAAAAPPPIVLCYVEASGSVPAEALDLAPCTHVVEAFLVPAADGSLAATNGLPRRELLKAARRHRAKTLVAVGGATVPGATWAALAGDPAARRRFLAALAAFVADGGYDGVDLDWEFPDPDSRDLHAALVREVRVALKRKLIAVGVTPAAHLEGYDFPSLAKSTDLFVHFGYDFRNPALGPWAHADEFWPDHATAPIEASVRGAASEMVRRGVPRAKLVIGMPLYASDGRPWAEVRGLSLGAMHPSYLENQLEGGAWVNGPAALEAKVTAALRGCEIDGGAAGGVALWQLGHQGAWTELTDAVARAVTSRRRPDAPAPGRTPASPRCPASGKSPSSP